MSSVESATKDWIRGPADEMAAENGCRFEQERGQFVVDWIKKYCRLYEGDYAGEHLVLRDWQLDVTMRLFGWVRWSEKWNRWVRRFRQASVWVPKKNKKSPTLAAWGLYLLCGDGEQGQKVYLAAKDGRQAREIAGKHALEMLLQSPTLMSECKVNQNLMQITHLPSRSVMFPLSSSNSRTQEGKEGLNGSVLIDETHVVDREFVDRISRAGISRSEPLHIEVSTAGNNPDGYGRERFDTAVEIQDGKRRDDELLTAIYTAPQDLGDDDLDNDPERYGKMANPAWGHTIDREEFLSDYARSKTSLTKLLNFKMYRLNIWQRSANPWLKTGDWTKCKQEFSEADLIGRECFAGLDLSRTRDMSALVLIFPNDDETMQVLPYFWMPEDEAKDNNHLANFLEWEKAGHLSLTPGNVVDYGYIRSAIRELAEKFVIKEIAYDQHYAEELTQAIEQGVSDRHGRSIRRTAGDLADGPVPVVHKQGPLCAADVPGVRASDGGLRVQRREAAPVQR
jgi:phage terminase large subunit-like protein